MYVCYTRTKVDPIGSWIPRTGRSERAKTSTRNSRKRRNGGMRDHTLEGSYFIEGGSGHQGEEA